MEDDGREDGGRDDSATDRKLGVPMIEVNASIEKLVEGWRQAKTHAEQARIEAHIWHLVPKLHRPQGGLMNALPDVLGNGVKSSDLKSRSAIYRAEPDSSVLWDRIEKGMPLRTASDLLARAKQRSLDLPLAERIREELRVYDSTGYEVRTDDGKVYRRGVIPLPIAPKTEDEFRSVVQELIHSFLANDLEGRPAIQDHVRKKLVETFFADLAILFRDWEREVDKAIGRLQANETSFARVHIIAACRKLSMDPPRLGKPVDLATANKQRKRLGRAYHPDAHGGETSLLTQFNEVMEAYRVLEQYNESLKEGAGDGNGN